MSHKWTLLAVNVESKVTTYVTIEQCKELKWKFLLYCIGHNTELLVLETNVNIWSPLLENAFYGVFLLHPPHMYNTCTTYMMFIRANELPDFGQAIGA